MAENEQQIGVTVELEAEKPVDIDVSKLIEKVEAKVEEAAKTPDPAVTPPTEKKEAAAEPVEIEIEPDGSAAKEKENDAVAELRAQLQAMQERADRTRQEAERERKAREDAEQLAQQAQREIAQSRMQLLQSNHQAILANLAANKADADALERAYEGALRKQDFATAAKCQTAMAKVQNLIVNLEDGRLQVEEAIKAGPKALPPQTRQPQQRQEQEPQKSGDPVEDYYRSRTPRVEKFLRSRDKAWVSDKKLNDKLVAAHYAAIADGYVNESEAYFDFIDKQMEPKKAEKAEREPKQVRKAVAAAPASPVKAASTTANGVNGTRVHLTPRERESAKFLGISEAEFARRKYIMSQPSYDGPKFD